MLWLCGPTGVGKSAVGFTIYQKVSGAGVTAAYLDLDQIGFRDLTPVGDFGSHRVKSRNLVALWPAYRAAGAECLVMVGPVENERAVPAYTDALPAGAVTVCRLHAGRGQLKRRSCSAERAATGSNRRSAERTAHGVSAPRRRGGGG